VPAIPFAHVISVADAALAVPPCVCARVLGRVFVPPVTGRASAVLIAAPQSVATATTGPDGPSVVLSDRYGFKVRGVNAGAVAAKVVRYQPLRYGADEHLICDPMDPAASSALARDPFGQRPTRVATLVSFSLPSPTRGDEPFVGNEAVRQKPSSESPLIYPLQRPHGSAGSRWCGAPLLGSGGQVVHAASCVSSNDIRARSLCPARNGSLIHVFNGRRLIRSRPLADTTAGKVAVWLGFAALRNPSKSRPTRTAFSSRVASGPETFRVPR
jgi:hypothetical protein